MPPARRHFVIIAALLSFSASARATEFTVNSWDLGIGVSAGFPNSVGSFFNQVTSPFVASHSVTLLPNYPNSTVSASYDIAFDESVGLARFLMDSTIAAEGVPPGPTLLADSTSRINLTPFVPLTVHVHGEFTFAAPADRMRAIFSFSGLGLTSFEYAFSQVHIFDTVVGPGAGTFVIDGEFILPSTETWQLKGTMRIETGTGSLGFVGTGSGFFDIQIVPEPTTLFLITAMLPFLRRPRR